MEFTMKTIVVLILLLIATLVLASIMLGWGDEATRWFVLAFEPMQDLVFGR
jgi:hypothetical protein